MRDYETVRAVLASLASKGGAVGYGAFRPIPDDDGVKVELERLDRDRLIKSSISFLDGRGACLGGKAEITDEGREFYRLIENDDVWRLVSQTLDAAAVDVPYPLLRDVCEEIVKRYVTSFIPEIGN